MTIHYFVCDSCGAVKTDTSAKDIHVCDCGQDMRWDLSGLTVNDNNNERWSVSMGVPASQVAEYRKKYPKSTYSDDGRLLIKSRKDKLRQAAERGFVELDDKN